MKDDGGATGWLRRQWFGGRWGWFGLGALVVVACGVRCGGGVTEGCGSGMSSGALGGEFGFYSGSYRSDDEEKIWDLPEKLTGKLFRRTPTVVGGGAVVAAGNGGERSDEDVCYVFVKNE
ncbi:hypothetical protein Tco_0988839 [Tanacetum coccineum]|uniref:Uncharacterized protein n=1 Tax=Tanacetum coccineum TaxID=301880 RepID=A0ABQ5ES30_9ASTR